VLRYAALCAALSTSEVAVAQEPTTLRFAFTAPATSYVNVYGADPWTKEVEGAAQGTLKIQLFPANVLGNVFNVYDRTVNGVVDLSFGTIGTMSQVFAKSNVSTLPFVGEDPYESSMALYRLFARGITADEFHAVKVITLFTFSSSGMHTNRPIRTLEDMRGLKLGAASKILADSLQLLGAVPITVAPAETYQSIQRNLISGTNMSWPGTTVFKLPEVAKNHLDVPFGLAGAYFFMNKDAFAKLPDKAKAAIDKYSGEPLAKKMGLGGLAADKIVIDQLKAMGDQNFTELSPAEKERWRTILAPVVEEWVKTTPDGARVLAAFKEELIKARNEPR
jgi:TRAP-type C4-dicarboxylate transport system substrate-binding protein